MKTNYFIKKAKFFYLLVEKENLKKLNNLI